MKYENMKNWVFLLYTKHGITFGITIIFRPPIQNSTFIDYSFLFRSYILYENNKISKRIRKFLFKKVCLTPSWSPTLSPPAVCAPCSSTLCDLWSEPGQVTIFMIPDLIKITWENVIMQHQLLPKSDQIHDLQSILLWSFC